MTNSKKKASSPPTNVEHTDSKYLGSKTDILRLRRRPLNLKNKNTRTRNHLVENQLGNENGISISETNSEIILISSVVGENESAPVAFSEPGKLSQQTEENKVCDKESRKEICESLPGIDELPAATVARLDSCTAEPCPILALSETPVDSANRNVSSTDCLELPAVDQKEPRAWEERDDLSQVTWDCSVQRAQSKRGQFSIDEVKKIASSFNNALVEQDQPFSNLRRLSLLHNSLAALNKKKRKVRKCQSTCEGRDLVREMVRLLSCQRLESQTESCKELRSSSETLKEISISSSKTQHVEKEGSIVGDDICSDADAFQNVTFSPEPDDRLASVTHNAKIMSSNTSAVIDFNLQSLSNKVSQNFSSSQIHQVSSSGTSRNSDSSTKSCTEGLLSTSLCDVVQSNKQSIIQNCFDNKIGSSNAEINGKVCNGDNNPNQANFRNLNLTDESDLVVSTKPSSPAPLQPEIISSYDWQDSNLNAVSPTFSNSLLHLPNSDRCFNELFPGELFEDSFSDAASSDWTGEELDVSLLQCDLICQSSTVPIVDEHKSVTPTERNYKLPLHTEKSAEVITSAQRGTDVGLEISTFGSSVFNVSSVDECFSEDVPEDIFEESFSEDASTAWSSQCSDEALLQCETVFWSSTYPLKDGNPSLFSAEHNVKLPFESKQIVHETSHCLNDDFSEDFLSQNFSSPTFKFVENFSDGYFSEDFPENLLEADTFAADPNAFSTDPNSFSEDLNTFSTISSTNWSSQNSDVFLIHSDGNEPSTTTISDKAMLNRTSEKLESGQLASGNCAHSSGNSSDARFFQKTSLEESCRLASAALAVKNTVESHTDCLQKESLLASPFLSSPVFLKTGPVRHAIQKSDKLYTFKKVSYALQLHNSPDTQWNMNVHSSGATSNSNSPVEETGMKLSEVSLENKNLNFFMDDDDDLFAAEVVPLLRSEEDKLSTTKPPACSQPRCSPREIEMKRQAALRKRARSQSRNNFSKR